MMRAAVVALLAGCVAVVGAWDQLQQLPKCMNEQCSDMVFVRRAQGDCFVMALADGNGQPDLYAYDPESDSWSATLGQIAPDPGEASMVYPSNIGKELFVLMRAGNGTYLKRYLFTYATGYAGFWQQQVETGWQALPGCEMVYRPDPDYSVLYRVPGWLYALRGGGAPCEFRRYPLQSYDNIPVDGVHPPDQATISDRTPLFVWTKDPNAVEYWLQVDTDTQFGSSLVSVQTSDPEYELDSADALSAGCYYWRTSVREQGQQWGQWGEAHEFSLLEGWESMASMPGSKAPYGGSMCYVSRPGGTATAIAESIYVLVGGNDNGLYRYSVGTDDWEQMDDTPEYQLISDLVAQPDPDPDRPLCYSPMQCNSQSPFGVDAAAWMWWYEEDEWHTSGRVPAPHINVGMNLAFDDAGEYLYFTPGASGTAFWRMRFDSGEGGQGISGPLFLATARARWSREGVLVEYSVEGQTPVRLEVRDIVGRRVLHTDLGIHPSGSHRYQWGAAGPDGSRVPAGLYFIAVDCGRVVFRLKVAVP